MGIFALYAIKNPISRIFKTWHHASTKGITFYNVMQHHETGILRQRSRASLKSF